MFNGIDQFYQGAFFSKSQTDQFIDEQKQLEIQVNNLLDIAQSLPTGCFKTIPIENNDGITSER